MTPDQERRKAEFDELFERLPGNNIERLRKVADVLFCQEMTVRIWRLKNPPRVIPWAKLKMLKQLLRKK